MTAAPALVTAITGVLAAPLLLTGLVAIGAASVDAAECTAAQQPRIRDLDGEQSRNAGIIVTVGQSVGVPTFGLKVALAAGMQESQLRNLPYGDRDSLGLFQQRPSAGWGTPAQLQDPVYAARAFFGGPSGPNHGEPAGLLDITGWQDMPLTVAAQTVQQSAFPVAYARWEADATALLGELLGTTGNACSPGGGLTCPPTGLMAEDGLTPDAIRVLRCLASHNLESRLAASPSFIINESPASCKDVVGEVGVLTPVDDLIDALQPALDVE